MFILDLVATFPSRYLFYTQDIETNQLLFMLKLLRLPKLGILWDTKQAHKLVKSIFKMRIEKLLVNAEKAGLG